MENITNQEKQNMDTILKLLGSFSDGNTNNLDDLIHDEFKNHHAPEGLQDKAGFHEIVKMVHGAFSSFDEINLTPTHLFTKGEMVAMMDSGSGKKNGNVYLHKDIHIFRMKDGKMYEHWNSFGLPTQRDVLMDFLEKTT